jgi:hypothetical protein
VRQVLPRDEDASQLAEHGAQLAAHTVVEALLDVGPRRRLGEAREELHDLEEQSVCALQVAEGEVDVEDGVCAPRVPVGIRDVEPCPVLERDATAATGRQLVAYATHVV